MKVAVSGANGFVGQALVQQLTSCGHQVLAYVRRPRDFVETAGAISMAMPDLSFHADWRLTSTLGIDVLVHCAARVHVMKDNCSNPLDEFRRINANGTANLARQAAAAGVRRFVYLSSIKVNGEITEVGRPFTANDHSSPEDPYGVSKLEAEQALHLVAADTGMEVVIIRPPLVYGPGVKANFESIMRWLVRRVPLPFAAVTENRRSLVALDNLVNLIMTCLSHPAAANQTFLVSDGEDLSTADLLRRIGIALRCPTRLYYMPPSVLKFAVKIVNRPGIFQRLCGSLELDITKTRQLLGWAPSVSVDEGLRRAAKGFRA